MKKLLLTAVLAMVLAGQPDPVSATSECNPADVETDCMELASWCYSNAGVYAGNSCFANCMTSHHDGCVAIQQEWDLCLAGLTTGGPCEGGATRPANNWSGYVMDQPFEEEADWP